VPFKKHEQAPLAEDPALRAVLAELDTEEAGTARHPLATALSAAATRARANRDISPRQIDAAVQRLGVLAAASRFDRTRFYDAVAVTSEADFFDPRADRVSLLTMHAAKGLEFPVVFIVGLEDGVMPLYWDHPNPQELEEERRLFYVGMTRAKDRLIMVRALKRLWRGRLRQLQPSPFLGDIEAELVKQQRRELPPRKPQDSQLTLF
jgi:DNA helicase II / ATP-dependent DNA helicase PcrA